MRVIGGSARGRRLIPPSGARVRPTADRVKESLFNILTALTGGFEQLRVLDLFAGTGNLGIEALSRGAGSAVFVDNHKDSVTLVARNLAMLGFASRAVVLHREAIAALRSLEKSGAVFDLVFIDPPYGQELAREVITNLAGSALIDDHSLVVAEFSSRDIFPEEFSSLREFDRRVYGDTALAFFRRCASE